MYKNLFLVSMLVCSGLLATQAISKGANLDSIFQDGFELTPFGLFKTDVQPKLTEACSSCHLGQRFGFTTLQRSGGDFTEEDTLLNHENFKSLISLDAPDQSRLLAKVLPTTDSRSIPHAGGELISTSSEIYQSIIRWIQAEKNLECADCGMSASVAYIAYIDQPAWHWAVNRMPVRTDWGLRTGAKLMLQRINPTTMQPIGAPIDFLNGTFCGSDGMCDFGRSSANHAGNQLVFECRLNPDRDDIPWLDLSWNICIAEIGADGQAINPRFLRPEADRHMGWSVSRIDPLGLFDSNGWGVRGLFDRHVRMRKKNDFYPIFSPDDQRVYFSSRSVDPRTGVGGTRAYHGFEHTNNIISTDLTGTDAQSVYLNEGGTAQEMTFLKNGNLALHVWNLERMDRHSYIQMTADGMMELPVLFGRVQGPNMWGSIMELANGRMLGMTGRRRGSISHFVPFSSDHTTGTGLDSAFPGFEILDPFIDAEMEPSFAYCQSPPEGTNCHTSRFYDDPAYAPNGQALITYHPDKTHYSNDDSADGFWQNYGGSIPAIMPYVPELAVALIDHSGQTNVLLTPDPGRALRYPAWVGKRQPPKIQPKVTDESQDTAQIHIADFPLWLSFSTNNSQNKTNLINQLDQIVAVRVLSKSIDNNACTSDAITIRKNVWTDVYDHPTHLGINNATGYVRYVVPTNLGGDQNGDIPLNNDQSVRMTVPAGQLLLFQGIDAQGFMVAQHRRVFALPPGHVIDTSVKRSQYNAQCSACHGSLNAPFVSILNYDQLATGMDFITEANTAVDVSNPAVVKHKLTFKNFFRPLINDKCLSCHGAVNPDGDLVLAENYSAIANYPVPESKWADVVNNNYDTLVPVNERVYGYAWSAARNYIITEGSDYINEFIDPMNPYQPMGALTPWDPGYQALFLPDENGELYFLTDIPYPSHFGRGGDFAQTSYLLGVLTGQDLDPRKNYTGNYDHSSLLTDQEVIALKALIDNGFPYMSRCDDKTVTEGINAGLPWGDPVEQDNL
ncbi:hypothetical protein [Marinicella meishanensis]|uniref:hypothetical protein n=1 Tax=Marinicella meishanensis TaxID=2873263 RepID=UPI001CBC254F|nr:hypothetical protein [Marinicella sp. NBU2979]